MATDEHAWPPRPVRRWPTQGRRATFGLSLAVLGGFLRRSVEERRRLEAELDREKRRLAEWEQTFETEVSERTGELEATRSELLQRLALAAEYRDDATSRHTQRVGATAAEIAARLGLDGEHVELIGEAAALHDIGKLGIPDTILLKPGPLSEEEYELMKTHAALGQRLLSGSRSAVLQMAAVIAGSHHERWDGTGYPAGLAGEAIPLVGRIAAVADVFDALTHDRPYKSLWPSEQAIGEIRRAAGGQFDPRVVDAFLQTREAAETPTGAGSARRPARRRVPVRRPAGAASHRPT